MGFSCVTYNIQYGFGMDGAYNLERIAEAVRGADVIALQEVTRHMPNNNMVDMVADLRALLPDYFAIYGSPFTVDVGSALENGRVVDRGFEFGNMVLCRTPIIASRILPLPRSARYDILNLQRCAVEAVIETPVGHVRFYSVHLDHASVDERLDQIASLKDMILDYQRSGGAVTALSSVGMPDLPDADHALALGDFNLEPEGAEYAAMCGTFEANHGRTRSADYLVDVTRPDNDPVRDALTYFDPEGKERSQRLDYLFATPLLAPHCHSPRVDGDDQGSDHRPVWVMIGD